VLDAVLAASSTTLPAEILDPMVQNEIIGKEFSRKPTNESRKDAEGEQKKF
jgi:hypothetical protein